MRTSQLSRTFGGPGLLTPSPSCSVKGTAGKCKALTVHWCCALPKLIQIKKMVCGASVTSPYSKAACAKHSKCTIETFSLKVDWRYHQVSSNRNTLIRRRLKAQPLTIKIVRPGGTVVFKKLGGPGGVPQNVVDTTTARFLACSRMLFSTPIST